MQKLELGMSLLLLCVPACFAQTLAAARLPEAPSALLQQVVAEKTASLSGDVADNRGGLIPGATIVATEKSANETHTVLADANGHFELRGLSVGIWSVRVSAAGFATFAAPPITLKIGERGVVPGIELPIAARSADVTVTVTTTELADQEIHDAEQQRVLAIFPNFYTAYLWNSAPLDTKQKFQLGIRSVTDPVSFIAPAIVAGAEQVHGTYPSWTTDATGYGKRYAAAYGDALFGRMLGSAVFPSVFRQDPRYFYMGPNDSTGKRVKHALLSGLVARGDNGKNEFNYSHILGNASAGALSTVYHPAKDVGPGELAYRNALIGIGGEGAVALLREFLWSKLTPKMPSYTKGKPAPSGKPNEAKP